MLVVGLTGGIGSGKSTVAAIFAQLGVPVIDTDVLAREAVEPGETALAQITEHFGPDILQANGRLDRARLRGIVFADPAQRRWLENLLHPLIGERLRHRIAVLDSPYCIVMSALLLETSQAESVDRILVVDAPEQLQLRRTMERDTNNEATVKSIMASQSSRDDRLARADDIIVNDRDLKHLQSEVGKLHRRYLVLAGQR
ncbi:MAG: hypothetical protein RLZZ385_889 [Pseudomonadota bacterium]|jgi:dephospho-CoA kinase